MHTTKVIYSSEVQNLNDMDQKQREAIAHLKLFYPDLQPDLVIRGNLSLSERRVKMLPDGLTVKGFLDIMDTDLNELPHNLTIEGDFIIDNNALVLHSCTKIGGRLDCIYHKTLPGNFTVGGTLLVSPYIDSLPANLTVGGNLDLSATKIKALPTGLKVMGNLVIEGLEITCLPNDLYVGGHLSAEKTKLKTIPSTVHLGGGLDIAHTPIKVFPKQLSRINGTLNITGTAIRKLPDNLVILGDAYFTSTPISEIPENLHVYGLLSLANSYVESIPDTLKAEGSVYLDNCPITSLPENFHVKEDLSISGTPITVVPEGLVIGGDFEFDESNITELPRFMNIARLHLYNWEGVPLPDGFTVTGDLSITYSSDFKGNKLALPSGLKVGGTLYVGTWTEQLPAGLCVGGDLDISNSLIMSFPNDARVGGMLTIGKQWSMITQFLHGSYKIEGTVEMRIEDYRIGATTLLFVKDEIKQRLVNAGKDMVRLLPEVKKSEISIPPTINNTPEDSAKVASLVPTAVDLLIKQAFATAK